VHTSWSPWFQVPSRWPESTIAGHYGDLLQAFEYKWLILDYLMESVVQHFIWRCVGRFENQPLVCNAQSSKGALHDFAGGFYRPTLNLCPVVRAFAEKV
jgi:hypothetical protein